MWSASVSRAALRSSTKHLTASLHIKNIIWDPCDWLLLLYRRPAYLSASGAGCPLLCRDQIPKIRRGPPSVDHRDCRERKPHCSHHRQTADHRGGTTSSHAECQPNSRCNFLIHLCCITDRKPNALLSVFRHINYKTILESWNIYTT